MRQATLAKPTKGVFDGPEGRNLYRLRRSIHSLYGVQVISLDTSPRVGGSLTASSTTTASTHQRPTIPVLSNEGRPCKDHSDLSNQLHAKYAIGHDTTAVKAVEKRPSP
ncbi:hypothetical protein Pdw03_6603 [Penicillium digitatum]|uniref:Uncharacterized protein n=1 Tax=Penicillium digitatum TaxID=36651 RepID=A0A7T6XKJ4_PENDI|nr:hypothetical protein Pdw03_6603 [Penicillium digitatum]